MRKEKGRKMLNNRREKSNKNDLTRFVNHTSFNNNDDCDDDNNDKKANFILIVNDNHNVIYNIYDNNNNNNNKFYKYCCDVRRQLILFIIILGNVLTTTRTTTFIQCAKLENMPTATMITTKKLLQQSSPVERLTPLSAAIALEKYTNNNNGINNFFDETNRITLNVHNNNNNQYETLMNDNINDIDNIDYNDGGISSTKQHDFNYKDNHDDLNMNANSNLKLKHITLENIYHILRDENEPLPYWRDAAITKYLHKRSIIKNDSIRTMLILKQNNLTEFIWQTYLNLNDLNNILQIDLSQNRLKHVDFKVFEQIRFLNLSYNNLTYIPLTENSSLISLNMNYNQIQTSTITFNLQLRELYLKGNQIQRLASLNLSALPNLEILDLSENLLQSFDDTTFFPQIMRQLKMLNLANNNLISIYRESFYNLLNLNTLILSWNHIENIDYETFLSLPNLQYLDLSSNRLKGLAIRALQGITGLEVLSIAYNNELGPNMQEFVASWSLKELDASGTGLCYIPAALAQSVRTLKLTNNWLKIINCGDLDSYPLLQYLDLSYSHIETIEDDALGRLEILEVLMLDHNRLDRVPLSLPTSLQHLFLQHNQIMDLTLQAFQNLNQLKTLDLSNNKLLYLPALPLTHLQTLNVQNDEIKGISQTIVYTMPRLNDLMLEGNPIKCSDLMGIAEWASICRLQPMITTVNNSSINKMKGNVTTANSTNIRKNDNYNDDNDNVDNNNNNIYNYNTSDDELKMHFNRMHNFYEQFEVNESVAQMRNRLEQKLRQESYDEIVLQPSCVHQFDLIITPASNNKDVVEQKQQQQQQQQEEEEEEEEKILINDLNGKNNTSTLRKFLGNFYRNQTSYITVGLVQATTTIPNMAKIILKEKISSLIGMKSFPNEINQTIALVSDTTQAITTTRTTTITTTATATLPITNNTTIVAANKRVRGPEHKIDSSWKQKKQQNQSEYQIVKVNNKNITNNLYSQVKYTTKTSENATDEMNKNITTTNSTTTTTTTTTTTKTMAIENDQQKQFLNIPNSFDGKVKGQRNANNVKKLSYRPNVTTTAMLVIKAPTLESMKRQEKRPQIDNSNKNNTDKNKHNSGRIHNSTYSRSNEASFKKKISKILLPTAKSSVTALNVTRNVIKTFKVKEQQIHVTAATTTTATTTAKAKAKVLIEFRMQNNKTDKDDNALKSLKIKMFKTATATTTTATKSNLNGKRISNNSSILNDIQIAMTTLNKNSYNNEETTTTITNRQLKNNHNDYNKPIVKSSLAKETKAKLQNQQKREDNGNENGNENQKSVYNKKNTVNGEKYHDNRTMTIKMSHLTMTSGNEKMTMSQTLEPNKSYNNHIKNNTQNHNYNNNTSSNNNCNNDNNNNNNNNQNNNNNNNNNNNGNNCEKNHGIKQTSSLPSSLSSYALHNNNNNNNNKSGNNNNHYNERLFRRQEAIRMVNVKVNEKENITALKLMKPLERISKAINVKEFTTIKDATTMKSNVYAKKENLNKRNEEEKTLNEKIVRDKLEQKHKHKHIYKHEPVQPTTKLNVKDRHLIGTPLLMHKGANFMVTTDELILLNNNNTKNTNNTNNSINKDKDEFMKAKMKPEHVSQIAIPTIQKLVTLAEEHRQLFGITNLDESQIIRSTSNIHKHNNNNNNNNNNNKNKNNKNNKQNELKYNNSVITGTVITMVSTGPNMNNTYDKFNIIHNDYNADTITNMNNTFNTAVAMAQNTQNSQNSIQAITDYNTTGTMIINEATQQPHFMQRDDMKIIKLKEQQQQQEILKPSLNMKKMTVITKQRQKLNLNLKQGHNSQQQEPHQQSNVLSKLQSLLVQQKQQQQQQQQQQQNNNNIEHHIKTNNDEVVVFKKFHELKPIHNNIYQKDENSLDINRNYNGDFNKELSTITLPIYKGKVIGYNVGKDILISNTEFQQNEKPLVMTFKQQMAQQHMKSQELQPEHQPQPLRRDIEASKTEHWLDIPKTNNAKEEQQQSIVVLITFLVLFVILLLGLMHVYRCSIPWRRYGATYNDNNNNNRHQHHNHHESLHQQFFRPWLQQLSSPRMYAVEGDEQNNEIHSFLSHHNRAVENKTWHHSIRQQAPHHSPLHNLHLRQLENEYETASTVATALTNNDELQKEKPKEREREREREQDQQQSIKEKIFESNDSKRGNINNNGVDVTGYATIMTNICLPLSYGYNNRSTMTNTPRTANGNSMNNGITTEHLLPSTVSSLSTSTMTGSSLLLSSSSSLPSVTKDDDTFSIEMAPLNGQITPCLRQLREELLPIELLQMPTINKHLQQQQHQQYKKTKAAIFNMHSIIKQTTPLEIEDEHTMQQQQQHQQLLKMIPRTASTPTVFTCTIANSNSNSNSSSSSSSSSNIKQLTPKKSRKLLLW